MRSPNKINWTSEVWQQYIEEALETAKTLRKLGALEAAARWDELAISRDLEHSKFVKPKIPYQE
jgi:hypothetical protein